MKKSLIISLCAAGLMLAACGTPQNISYFQDTADAEFTANVKPQLIRLQPEDKISIIVNTTDQKLSNLFNIPYTSRYLGAQTDTYVSSSQGVSCYTIDAWGEIDFPVIGKVKVGGLTREEVADAIKSELERQNLVKNPIVTVEFQNLSFSLMGEVGKPGRYAISKDHITILDALAMGGDLTIYGRRDNIRVLREKDGKQQSYIVNLCQTSDVVNSPAFFLQQNDIIYVEPNDVRARQSTVNGNNVLSTSFWISVASLAATIVTTVSVVLSRTK